MKCTIKLIARFGVSVGYRSIAMVVLIGSTVAFVSDGFMQLCDLLTLELVPNFVWKVCTYSVIILGMFFINYVMYNVYDPIKMLLTQLYPDQVKSQINRVIILIMNPLSTLISAASVYICINVLYLPKLLLFVLVFFASFMLNILSNHVTKDYVHKISERLIKKSLVKQELGMMDKETQ